MRYIFILLTICSETVGNCQDLNKVKGQLGTNDSFEDIFASLNGGCSLSCGIGWTLSSTSTLTAQATNSYDAKNMDDGQRETAWVEGSTGYGIAEKIIVTFEGDINSRNVPFRALQITNGYAKSLETWQANSRVKVFKLSLNGQDKLLIELEDSIYPQYVELGRDILVSNGDRVALEIVEVFKGSKFADTAISDLSLDGAH